MNGQPHSLAGRQGVGRAAPAGQPHLPVPKLVTITNCCTPAASAAFTRLMEPSPSTFLTFAKAPRMSFSAAPTALITCEPQFPPLADSMHGRTVK